MSRFGRVSVLSDNGQTSHKLLNLFATCATMYPVDLPLSNSLISSHDKPSHQLYRFPEDQEEHQRSNLPQAHDRW